MAMASNNKKVTLKLLVDKEKKRVVLAEADKDLVDILFSFLTLPMGTIVRLLGKPSELGCFSHLYASAENLSYTHHFSTEACKTILLWPRSEAAVLCEDLKINIDDTKTREFYRCDNCIGSKHYSNVVNTVCPVCGKLMSRYSLWNKQEDTGFDDDGVFMKGRVSFMVTDDLHVSEASTRNIFAMLEKLGVKDRSILEEMALQLGQEEILNLLKRSLISVVPLSDLCFSDSEIADSTNNKDMNDMIPTFESEKVTDKESKKISTRLLVDEANNRVVYVEAGEDLTNLLFSFLTFPLGSVIKILKNNSSMGCVDNLYRSVQDLSIQCFKYQEIKTLLLSPKIAPYFGWDNQLLNVDEVKSYGGLYCTDYCFWRTEPKDAVSSSPKCRHPLWSSFQEMNPKIPKGVKESGGRYVKWRGLFVVMDNLGGVTPLTPISTINAVNKFSVPSNKLVEKEASIGEIEALDLLKSALTSQSALTNVFCPGQKMSWRWMGPTLDQ